MPPNEYAQLKLYVYGCVSFIGNMTCAKTFSKIKYVKSHYRAALTDEHL